MPVHRDECCERLPMAGGQTLGKVKPSWPVGGQNTAAETLPRASPDAGPDSLSCCRSRARRHSQEERRMAFPGAGTPWEKEAARLVAGPSLRGVPIERRTDSSPRVNNPDVTHPHWTLTTRRSIVCWAQGTVRLVLPNTHPLLIEKLRPREGS